MQKRVVFGILGWAAVAFLVIESTTGVFGLRPQVPHIGWIASGSALFVIGSAGTAAGQLLRRRQRSKAVNDALKLPGAPELEKTRFRTRIDYIPKGVPGQIITVVNAIEDAYRHTVGQVTISEFLKADDTDEGMFMEMKRKVADSRGLNFLSREIQDIIFWYIVHDRLKTIKAHGAAKLAAIELQAHAEHNYQFLFEYNWLTKIDASNPRVGETYFSRFFQPLMVAFAEQQFADSPGEGRDDENGALMQHLVHAKNGQILAARLDGECRAANAEKVRRKLPLEPPRNIGLKHERSEAKKRNDRDAARAILVITSQQHHNLALAFDAAYRPEESFRSAGIDIDYWTPDLAGDHDQCFLWQRKPRKK